MNYNIYKYIIYRMLKNYLNNDKQTAIKLKKILKKKYTPVENVDDTNLSTNQDNQADFLALRIIDNLIRFNQSFRLSQVAIKANMGKYNKKGGMIEQEQKEEKELKEKARDTKNAQGLLENITKGLEKKADKVKKEQEEEAKKEQEEKAKKQKDLEELEDKLNEFDGDNRFPSSFESLISAYGLMESINRNYRDMRAIFSNLSVPVFNDLNDVLNETNELINSSSVKKFNIGNTPWTKKSISYNIDDYRDKFNKIVSTFDNIYNDFQQRKQTFNTNIKTGSGFDYLTKIRNI